MWRTIEMIESPVMQVLSKSEHLVLLRLEIELGHHGGTDNGKLLVTFRQFRLFGVDAQAVAPALRVVSALGLVEKTHPRGDYFASSDANHAAPAAVALSHAIWTVTPARREAASCWQACKKWFLDPVISSPDSITKSLDRPSTSLSASLAGEPLATLKTETAYRALIKPSYSPILLLDLHHNRIARKVSKP